MFLLTGNSRWLQLLCDSYPLRNMKRKRSCYKNELNPYQAIQCRLGSGRMMPVRARNTREPVNNRCSDYIWWVYGLTGCTDATLDRSPQISQVTIGDWEARRPINSQQIQLCVGAVTADAHPASGMFGCSEAGTSDKSTRYIRLKYVYPYHAIHPTTLRTRPQTRTIRSILLEPAL